MTKLRRPVESQLRAASCYRQRMHKAIARDLLLRAGWTDAELTMTLRIMAYDGARRAPQIAGALAAFADRAEDPGEAAIWRGIADRVREDARQAEALQSLRAL